MSSNNYINNSKLSKHTATGYSYCILDPIQIRKDTFLSPKDLNDALQVLTRNNLITVFNNNTRYIINFDYIFLESILDRGKLIRKQLFN